MLRLYSVFLGIAALTACASDSAGGLGPSDPRNLEGIDVDTLTRVNAEGDYYCRSGVTGTFENIIVPEGATCTVASATMKGNFLAKDGARLYVLEVAIKGNIEGAEAAVVHVRGGRIEGNIQAQEGSSEGEGIRVSGGTVLTQGNITIKKMRTGTITITDTYLVKGNIQVQENTVGDAIQITGNRVAQNLEVFVNDGNGAKVVTGNRVSQKLSCKDNQGPFTGTPNQAGDVEGQCA